MPVKYRVKNYQPGGIYHIYSRAWEGREVFRDYADYMMFVGWMQKYLLPVRTGAAAGYKAERPYRLERKLEMNLAERVEMWAYCLMPDHFHLLLKQNDERGIAKFMRRMMTGFVMDYNRKYKRRGMLWDGVYRAARVIEEEVVDATKMIHLNPVTRTVRRFGPVETVTGSAPGEYLYSSYKDYMIPDYNGWVKTYRILELVGGREKYRELVERGPSFAPSTPLRASEGKKGEAQKHDWEID